MTHRLFAKPALLHGCALIALLAGASFASQSAKAQGIQADGMVFQGSATIDDSVAGTTTITVETLDTVIDWTPTLDPLTGNAEIFLPDGNIAIFQNGFSNADFAVLNRILPDSSNNPAVFEGLVQSFLTDFSGVTTPGGFVAFYSPSGIIVGPTGRFEVPQLMLTTQQVNLGSFANFAAGTNAMIVNGSTGSIDIQAGATLVGTPEDSFLIVASPQITMAGDAYYNGSIAYIASTAMQVTHSSGLFDIIVLGGAAGGVTIDHSGSSGGPSSTGAGDEHVIYGVTSGALGGGGVSMLFSGNLGFDPAVSAGVVNGDIILSANYNVTGRTVDGDDNRQGADGFFNGRSSTPGPQGDILLSGIDATSNLLAIASHQVNLDATTSSSTFESDLSLVGREQAIINADSGQQVFVGGDLLVSARNFGLLTQAANEENAVGGFASIRADVDSLVSVTGDTTVAASALPGVNGITNTVGSGTGGQAQILAEGGTIDLGGNVAMEAYARTDLAGTFAGNGVMAGGSVQFLSNDDGRLSAVGNLTVDAGAATPDVSAADDSLVNDIAGGDILIGTGPDGGTTTVDGNLTAAADAVGNRTTLGSGSGASASGGNVQLDALLFGLVSVGGDVALSGRGLGGAVDGGGDAGLASGGNTFVNVSGMDLSIGGQLTLDSRATAGVGLNGGSAVGGNAEISNADGLISLDGPLSLDTSAQAGDSTGGGLGGSAIGGDIIVQMVGPTASLIPTNSITIRANATGGRSLGGTGDGGGAQSGDIAISIADSAQLSLIGGAGATATIETVAIGGDSEVDGATGGAASSGAIDLLLDDGTLNIPAISLLSSATGGSEFSSVDTIAGGDAIAGPVIIDLTTGSDLTAQVQAQSTATGGTSVNGVGGDATSGDVVLAADNALVDLGANSSFTSSASFNTGTAPASATSGAAGLNLADTLVSGGDVAVLSEADGTSPASNGTSTAGDAFLITSGSGSVDLTSLSLISSAQGVAGGTAATGAAELTVQGSLVTVPTITMSTDTGGAADGTPGQILLTNISGAVDTETLTVSALGDNPGLEAQITASDGGQISILALFDADVTGNIALSYTNGGSILGGIGPDDLTGDFTVDAGDTISLTGDDATIRSIGAITSTYTSSDIAVGPDTRFGGDTIALVSTETAEQAVLGGTLAGAGYSLLQAEASAIDGNFLSITLPNVVGTEIDAIVNDLAFAGTNNFGFSEVSLFVSGSLDVLGALQLGDAGVDDILSIIAENQVQITLPAGSITVDNGGTSAGLLRIDAETIVAADAALIAQIEADPFSQAVADALLDDGGAATASNFILADRVELMATNHILTQNTGANDVYGGITVGAGGLSILQATGAAAPLQVIAFGLQETGGVEITNDDWFALVEFDTNLAATYTAEATFNNCIIVTSTCPVVVTPTPTPTPTPYSYSYSYSCHTDGWANQSDLA